MADLGISIAEKLIEVIGSAIIKEICDMWGYKSELADLGNTVATIKNVLRDAEAQQDMSNEAQGYIEELKAAVYDADDLFDEFLTLAELKQLDTKRLNGKKLFKKVRHFFSSKKKGVSQAYRMSHQIKDLKKQLDGIVSNHQNFGLSIDYKPISRRIEETFSLVKKDIIGREDEIKVVKDMLLGPNVNEDFRFVSIVGMGGLGKTTLAQLVFNDEEVKKEFPEAKLRLWVCVADQNGVQFDVKAIICKILELVTSKKPHGDSAMELVQRQFREHFGGKKYLLVLDDVWNEDRDEWLKLEELLRLGREGSRIVVTTRSEGTTTAIGGKHTYKLGGLSPENSWRLFELAAFDKGDQHVNHLRLVGIGKKIVEKCYNIPLTITVVGTLLFGQGISQWSSFEKIGLPEIDKSKSGNTIMSILKLSYHNLKPSLKSCFSYCALFPKGTVLERELVISLWISQGYIVSNGDKSIEDIADEHFLILLRRCFFEGVQKNYFGEIESFKLHDLMHDVAEEVGRKEICVVSSIRNKLGDTVRHVCCIGDKCVESFFIKSNIRSFICWNPEKHEVYTQINRWMCLRFLELQGSSSLPNSIGKLLHLRYLDLSYNQCDVLSDSITELHNLQTLILRGCQLLYELPKKFSNLVKLRHLDLEGCDRLIGMPPGMHKLTSLRLLPIYVVGIGERTSSECDGELKDLKALTKIRGSIIIKIGKYYREGEEMNDKEGGNLESMENLTNVQIDFSYDRCVDPEGVMEKLKPHSNIKGLQLWGYRGKIIPKWGRAVNNWASSLPHLVNIELRDCISLKQIPTLSELPYLKSLVLYGLEDLEYMEKTRSSTRKDSEVELAIFFPSLEFLHMSWLASLQRWWRKEDLVIGDDDNDHGLRRRLGFPRLSQLKIRYCYSLTSFPPCLSLEDLELHENNRKLRIIVDEREHTATSTQHAVRLKKVKVDNVMGTLSSIHLPCLTILHIDKDKVESLSEVGEVFHSCSYSLRTLTIEHCRNLRRLFGGGLEHLTTLESLTIVKTDKLSIFEDKDDDEDDAKHWKSLNRSLRSLIFENLENMTSLPKELLYLSSLQSLRLNWCYNLKELPKWITSLPSLQSLSICTCSALKSLPKAMPNLQTLVINDCSALSMRCRKPDGEDFSKIEHIPHIHISND